MELAKLRTDAIAMFHAALKAVDPVITLNDILIAEVINQKSVVITTDIHAGVVGKTDLVKA
jgi:hypothetical protein